MLKDIILWKYERASWQWDLLCCLIMVFIFLTPKTWFDRQEKLTLLTTQISIKAENSASKDNKLQQRGNPEKNEQH
jgi:hypothetical protein